MPDKATAHIDEWTYDGGVLIGRVSNHSRQGEFKAPLQMTSTVLRLDREKGEAETLNTLYTLGREVK